MVLVVPVVPVVPRHRHHQEHHPPLLMSVLLLFLQSLHQSVHQSAVVPVVLLLVLMLVVIPNGWNKHWIILFHLVWLQWLIQILLLHLKHQQRFGLLLMMNSKWISLRQWRQHHHLFFIKAVSLNDGHQLYFIIRPVDQFGGIIFNLWNQSIIAIGMKPSSIQQVRLLEWASQRVKDQEQQMGKNNEVKIKWLKGSNCVSFYFFIFSK